MNNIKELMKNNSLLRSYIIVQDRWKNDFWDHKIDMEMNEFIVMDDYMLYVLGIIEQLTTERKNLSYDIIPKMILDEFDKVAL